MNPAMFPQCKNRRAKVGKRADLGGMFFRSAWEANYARYLNWLVERGDLITWDYESETFQFEKIKRGSRFYTPDFKLFYPDQTIEYHEIKGYMDPRSATKLRRMKKYYPQIPIVLIGAVEYAGLAAQLGRVIVGWEGSYGMTVRPKRLRK